MNRFEPGDRVFYDDNPMTVVEGPYRTLEYPNVDHYGVKGRNGYVRTVWASDLLSEEEYHAD